MDDVAAVLWWVPEGHRPTADEAIERLEHLRRHGPTSYAFTFRHRYDPHEASIRSDELDTRPS